MTKGIFILLGLIYKKLNLTCLNMEPNFPQRTKLDFSVENYKYTALFLPKYFSYKMKLKFSKSLQMFNLKGMVFYFHIHSAYILRFYKVFHITQGCIKPPKIIFYPPPHLRKSFFLSRLQHLVATHKYKTFGGSSGIQHLGAALWQLWDTNSQKNKTNK